MRIRISFVFCQSINRRSPKGFQEWMGQAHELRGYVRSYRGRNRPFLDREALGSASFANNGCGHGIRYTSGRRHCRGTQIRLWGTCICWYKAPDQDCHFSNFVRKMLLLSTNKQSPIIVVMSRVWN